MAIRSRLAEAPFEADRELADFIAELDGVDIGHEVSPLGSGGMRSKVVAAEMATAAGIPGVEVVAPPDVNAVFVRLPAAAIVPLQEWSFFWEWDLTQSLVRWMTSFATTPEDTARFVAGVREILSRRPGATGTPGPAPR